MDPGRDCGKTENPMKIYLASRYSRREELCAYRAELEAMGHTVTSRWLNGEHQIDDKGKPLGDHGEALVEGTLRSGEIISEREVSARADALRAHFVKEDCEDVCRAECVISFTEPPRSTLGTRGGRHVEFGLAVAWGKILIVVGYRENLFHYLPLVQFCADWEAAKSLIGRTAP
jgi:hypothetical protein